MAVLIKLWLVNLIKKRIKKAMFKKLIAQVKNKAGVTSAIALVIGVVSQLLGVDIAPTQVDAVVTGIAAVITIYQTWQASRVVSE